MADGIPGRLGELGRPVIGPVGEAAGSGTAFGNVTTHRRKMAAPGALDLISEKILDRVY